MKTFKHGSILLTIITTSVIAAIPVKAETFLDPQLQGKYIDACLESYRFSDSCSKAAAGEIAQQFCRAKGYSTWTKWQAFDFGWKSRTTNWKWKELWDNGNLKANFYQSEGARRFTTIECR